MMGVMKKRHRRMLWWAAIIVLLLGAGGFAFAKWNPQAWQNMLTQLSGAPVPPKGWIKYENQEYGFSFFYPPDWQFSTSTLAANPPAVILGNPLEGTTTYEIRVSIEKNPDGLSSAAYVEKMLSTITSQDQAGSVVGAVSQVSAQYAAATGFAVGNNQEYELDNVFEFDHHAEQIYAARGHETILFDFPVADQNPNIASSTENNAIAHEIVGTLIFTK